MSQMGHSLPIHSAPVPTNVRVTSALCQKRTHAPQQTASLFGSPRRCGGCVGGTVQKEGPPHGGPLELNPVRSKADKCHDLVMQLPMKLQLLGAASFSALDCRLQSCHFTFSMAHFFLAESHSLRVIDLVWSPVKADVEESALVPVVAGAGFAGSGVCCAAAIPEYSARASADSTNVVVN